MSTDIDQARLLAYLRVHVTMRLLEQLAPETVRECAPGRLTIQIRTPGGPACHVLVVDGAVRFVPRRRALASVTLLFPRPEHLTATLSGGKAPVVPLPGSLRFLGAIKAFRALTSALQKAMADAELRPRLLLLATLYAVQEVANRDPYVASRVARIARGTIRVSIAGDASVVAWVRRDTGGVFAWGEPMPDAAHTMTVGADGPGVQTSIPNAELEFADRQAAIDLLTGATPAMLALAERRVRLYGRVSMIQNLFPVLDRVSDYLGG